MKKQVITILILVAVAAGAWVTWTQFGAGEPKAPDQVVLDSFRHLRNADFDGLRRCYSVDAWKLVSKVLPANSDEEAIARLRESMAGLKSMDIESTTIRNDETAEVVVLIHRTDEVDQETFHLRRIDGRWLID